MSARPQDGVTGGQRPLILDLFSKQGGAGWGYHLAGFRGTGVDIEPQPRYPLSFVQADALDVLADKEYLACFDAIHASPPCQAHSNAQRIRRREHPDLIGPVREALIASGKPYVIENVRGAPLLAPVELCGCMFPELNVYRERLFETSFPLLAPPHVPHREPVTKMGRPPRPGERMHVVGNFSGVAAASEAMGIGWMSRDGLREAIPPAYTRFIGEALMNALRQERAA